ncbi:MAG TPA: hypothetical protein VKQ72_02195 [Aggregatilineales bacterium]|nr:hypothetical protein [Aggregatilineales bacterium]
MLKGLPDRLQSPDPQIRVETLCALVMVLETEALDILRKLYDSEQVPQVKEVVQWAGRQILAASQQGYSTTAAMRFAYHLDLTDQGVTQDDLDQLRLEAALYHTSTPSSKAELDGLKSVEQLFEEERVKRQQPVIPPKPTDTNIAAWLKKLDSPDAQTRLTAVRHLEDFNNPAALGPLGWAFARDTNTQVRQKAQHSGQQIYYAALYWQDSPA